MNGVSERRVALEPIFLLGPAFPGAILGVGYLLAFNNPPLLLTGTTTIIIINCVFRNGAIGEEARISKIGYLSVEIEEASSNSGASTITTFRRLVLPIIFPAFMYGFIYVFMRTMVTLSAMIFLIFPRCMLVLISLMQELMENWE